MFRRFFQSGGRLDEAEARHHTEPWYKVLWLTGVDYFSTLGYQPGIALLAAGAIAPLATCILVLVTLGCALPVYAQVARRSYVGQGSIALLENLLEGWKGKILVLALLGFAATDFVITMTLSAADAAQHAIENPFLHHFLEGRAIEITLLLLALLAGVFLKGFKEAIGLAAVVAIPYLLLNAIVLGRGVFEILRHPEALSNWRSALELRGDLSGLALAAIIIFPRLALGLSGFETGVSVMPLVRAATTEARIASTRKLLIAAAVIMSGFLIASSFVTTLLIPSATYQPGGKASGRAIAYLAHEYLGGAFGTVYDISTIVILWFAGASAMAGLLHLIPRYLPRFGMAPEWVSYTRPLVLVLFAADVIVTLAFRANVDAQGGAYATGVLVLMLSAAFAAALALWRERSRMFSVYAWVVTGVFAFTLVDNVYERPDGIIIASIFIVAILAFSGISRYRRATEMRITGMDFADEESRNLWSSVVNKRVHLAPVRAIDRESRMRKRDEIQRYYRVTGTVAFVNVKLLDNRSEFLAPVLVKVRRDDDSAVQIEVSQAVAIANTIAFISERIDPISIFLGLSRQNLMDQALRYFLVGEGETGLMVYTILLRYWEMTPEDDVRPLIFLMSD